MTFQNTGWKVMGSTSVGGSEKSFSEDFDLRTLLRYLHFIQVTIHLSFIHFKRKKREQSLLKDILTSKNLQMADCV